MSGLAAALASLVARLSAHQARFALVGGLAVSVRTGPRFTRAADVCVAIEDDHAAEELIGSLRMDGYVVVAIVEQEARGRIATVRLEAGAEPDDGIVLDLLFASSGIEREVVETADELEVFEDIRVPVASIACLIALKVLARDDRERPQDRVDLVALLRTASAIDVSEASALVRLIGQRGYDRGKDLIAELDGLQAELGLPS